MLRRAFVLAILATVLVTCLCGAAITSAATLTDMLPTKATAGDNAFVLGVAGYGLTGFNWISFGSTFLLATHDSDYPDNILLTTVPAAAIAFPGVVEVRAQSSSVNNPSSNPMYFVIEAPVPDLASITPAGAWAGSTSAPPLVTLSGSAFFRTTKALVNSVERPTTYVDANHLTVQLTASDVAAPGTLVIAARNPAPGGGSCAGLAFTVGSDVTAPVTTIGGADANWHNTQVTLTVTATDAQSGVQNTQYSIAGVSSWTTLTGKTITVPAPAYDHSGDGIKVVSVRSTDNCGNVETPAATVTVKIDTRGPMTTATAPGSIERGKNMVLGYRAAELLSPTCAIVLTITKRNGASAKTFTLGQKPSNVTSHYRFKCTLAKGKYKYSVNATDLAGNAQTSVGSKTFVVK